MNTSDRNHPSQLSAQPSSGQSARGRMDVRYSVIVPVYNEAEVLMVTHARLKAVMETLGEAYELIFVNDGSSDGSRELLERLIQDEPNVKVLNFSRNFGHQIAISAGMEYACGDAVIVIDADLQDPPELIIEMIARWRQGYEVVYAKRLVRRGETWFKRWSALLFYRALRWMTDVDIPVDVGDFRLIDRKVCDVMNSLREKSRFVRGMVAWAGFRQTGVEYVREPRYAGETKYPLKRMLRLSADAMTSFSEKPLKFAMYTGGLLTLASAAFILIALGMVLLTNHAGSGMLLFGGICVFFNSLVLVAIGILGQYVARVHDEARDRPLYILDDRLGFEQPVDGRG